MKRSNVTAMAMAVFLCVGLLFYFGGQEHDRSEPIPQPKMAERVAESESLQPDVPANVAEAPRTGLWVLSETNLEPPTGSEVWVAWMMLQGEKRALSPERMGKHFAYEEYDSEHSYRVRGNGGFFALPPGKVHVSVRAPGHLMFQGIVEISGEETLILEPVSMIRVYCSSGGRFLRGVGMVVTSDSEEDHFEVSAISGQDGIAVIEVPEGTYRIDYKGGYSVKSWEPSADSERYRYLGLPGTSLQNRLSQFPLTKSGAITVGKKEVFEAELELWAETRLEGVIAFPAIYPGYSRIDQRIYVGTERKVPGPDGEERTVGSYAETGTRTLPEDGVFSFMRLIPGNKIVRASCTDLPPEGSGQPVIFWTADAETFLEPGQFVDMGVIWPGAGMISGVCVFRDQDREYSVDEVCNVSEALFSFGIYSDQKGDNVFYRAGNSYEVKIGAPFEIRGIPHEPLAGDDTTFRITRGWTKSAFEGGDRTLLADGWIPGRNPSGSLLDVRIGENFRYELWIEKSPVAPNYNVEFLPSFPNEIQRDSINIWANRDGVTSETITTTTTFMEPGIYDVFARGRGNAKFSGFGRLEVPTEGIVRFPIAIYEGATIEVGVDNPGPTLLTLQPLELDGSPWKFDSANSPLYLADSSSGQAVFEGVQFGVAFKVVPTMPHEKMKYGESRVYIANGDMQISFSD